MKQANDNSTTRFPTTRKSIERLKLAVNTAFAFWHMDHAIKRLEKLDRPDLAFEIRSVLLRTPIPTNDKQDKP